MRANDMLIENVRIRGRVLFAGRAWSVVGLCLKTNAVSLKDYDLRATAPASLVELAGEPEVSSVVEVIEADRPDNDQWYPPEQLEFRECETCAAKPGSPFLCAGCLHNRSTIDWLLDLRQEHLKFMKKERTKK